MSATALNALLGAQTKDSVSWLLNACFRNRHNSSLVRFELQVGRLFVVPKPPEDIARI